MFTIGQFSRITELTIKSLRRYHEAGILIPNYIDDDSGYRYYKENAVEKAKLIKTFKDMEFTLSDIKHILQTYSEDEELIVFMEKQKKQIAEKIGKYKNIEKTINSVIETSKRNEIQMNSNTNDFKIIEKNIEDFTFAGYRMKGCYEEIGKAFSKVGRKAGHFINGKAMALYYDDCYKEENADMEGGFPVKKEINSEEINCRILKGGKAVCLIHKGSYNTLTSSYEKILNYINEKKYKTKKNSREVYLKGPGMIFKGNPDKYLTEIQFLVK